MKVTQAEVTDLLVSMNVDNAASWDIPRWNAKLNRDGGISRYVDAGTPELTVEQAILFEKIRTANQEGDLVEVVPEIVVMSEPDDEPPVQDRTPLEAGDFPLGSPQNSLPENTSEEEPETFSLDDGVREESTVETATATAHTVTQTVKPKTKSKRKKAVTRKVVFAKKGKPKTVTDATKPKRGARTKHTGRPSPYEDYTGYRKYVKANPLQVDPNRGVGIMREVIRILKKAGSYAKPRPITKREILTALLADERFEDRDGAKMLANINNLIPTRLRDSYGIHVWRGESKDGARGYYIVNDGKKPQPQASE